MALGDYTQFGNTGIYGDTSGNYYIPKNLVTGGYFGTSGGGMDPNTGAYNLPMFRLNYDGTQSFFNPQALGFSDTNRPDMSALNQGDGSTDPTYNWLNQLNYTSDPSGQQFLDLGQNPFVMGPNGQPIIRDIPQGPSTLEAATPLIFGAGGLAGVLGGAAAAAGSASEAGGAAGGSAGAGIGGGAGATAGGDAAAGLGASGGLGDTGYAGLTASDLPGGGFGAGASGDSSLFGGYTVDPNTGDVIPTGGAGGTGVPAGGTVSGGGMNLGGAAGSAISRLLGGGGSSAGGNPLMNFLTGSGSGPSLPSLAPGLLALNYARQQTPVDTSQLQNVFNNAGANQQAFIQASQAPLQQAQAGGYGDILQSQGARGIRGSSFGNQDIANYLNTTNQGISNAGITAAQSSLGLQGSLAGQISNLNALSQQMKNDLYGRAFSSLGQGLNPTPGIGGAGGAGGAAGGGSGGFLSNLGIGGLGNAFGNGLTSIGSGLGRLFGSPGSTWWGTGSTSPVVPPLANSGLDSINYAGDYGLSGV